VKILVQLFEMENTMNRLHEAERVAELYRDDVQRIATETFKTELTEEQAIEALEMYPSEQEQDPTGTWDLVIEHVLDQILRK